MDQSAVKVGPKDVFLHLLAIGTLYASAVSLGVLLFNYIDLGFPDRLRDAYYAREGIRDAIRFAVSTLIVVFPVYFLTSRFLRKAYESEPERKSLGIRRWLSYFTMFLGGVIGIGWLIAVINKFLQGDFTVAFLLKALVIFFITGSVFYYYRAVTKGEEIKKSVRYYAYFVAVVVLAAVVAAFFAVGSPQERRLRRQDMQRVSDLQMIQSYIGEYFRMKERLPAKLADLNDPFREVSIPKDPETGAEYEYRVAEDSKPSQNLDPAFQLCAEFAYPWSPDDGFRGDRPAPYPDGGGYFGSAGENWKHGAGRQCFERTIDKDYFLPPVKGQG